MESLHVDDLGVLSLDDLVEIALERNLDLQVKAWEAHIQKAVLHREIWAMMPEFEISYDTRGRNNNPGSSSQSLVPGIPPAPPSVSSEKNSQRTLAEVTFRLIDFGIAYVQSHQEANRLLIKRAEYDRVRQNLILEVIQHYWKAAAAKVGIEGIERMQERVENYLQSLDRLMRLRILSQMEGLENQYTILNVRLDYLNYRRIYNEEIIRLKELLGLTPNTHFEISIPDISLVSVPIADLKDLEEIALRSRPELFIKDFEETIACDEIRKAIINLVPGAEVFFGYNRDSNEFLIERSWLHVGFLVIGDLFDLPRKWQQKKVAERERHLARLSRFLTSMAVMTQVHLAYFEYQDELKRHETVFQIDEVKRRLLEGAIKETLYGGMNEFQVISFEAESLLAKVRDVEAYGYVYYALEKVNNAIGKPQFYRIKEQNYDTCATTAMFDGDSVLGKPAIN
ncbi:MAG: hypothetical protein Tsb0021_18060 [Chlamydiales bacterium]